MAHDGKILRMVFVDSKDRGRQDKESFWETAVPTTALSSPAPDPSGEIAEALKVLRTNPDLAKLIMAFGKRSPQA